MTSRQLATLFLSLPLLPCASTGRLVAVERGAREYEVRLVRATGKVIVEGLDGHGLDSNAYCVILVASGAVPASRFFQPTGDRPVVLPGRERPIDTRSVTKRPLLLRLRQDGTVAVEM